MITVGLYKLSDDKYYIKLKNNIIKFHK